MSLDAGFAGGAPGGWVAAALLLACVALGFAAGLLYFRALRHGVELLTGEAGTNRVAAAKANPEALLREGGPMNRTVTTQAGPEAPLRRRAPVGRVLLLTLARFMLLAAVLYAVARAGGALPLLAASAGFLLARTHTVRRARRLQGPAA